MEKETILLVDDDPAILEVVSKQVLDLGYHFDTASDGDTAIELALSKEYALIILDLGLPELGGLEVCRRIRQQREQLPILILTAETGETKTVLGLELGADDYMQKPVRSEELRARIRAILRRASRTTSSASNTATPITIGDITIDPNLRQVRTAEDTIELTTTEFDILLLLASEPNRVFSRDAIIDAIWEYSNYSSDQNIRTHLSRIRVKLEKKGSRPPYIINQRGFGYRIAHEEDREKSNKTE